MYYLDFLETAIANWGKSPVSDTLALGALVFIFLSSAMSSILFYFFVFCVDFFSLTDAATFFFATKDVFFAVKAGFCLMHTFVSALLSRFRFFSHRLPIDSD